MRSLKERKYRHEYKFYINYGDYYVLRSRLRPILKMDSHARDGGQYLIRSLYFDDYKNSALVEKQAGLKYREKFRIRFYNHDPSFIRLEKKVKNKKLTAKWNTLLTKEECEKIIDGDIEWLQWSNQDLLHELYIKMSVRRYQPKTIVDYTREAYIYGPGNVRITFDQRVRSGLFSNNLFNKEVPTVEVLEPGCMILEVKFDEYLPDVITDIIQTGERRVRSVSKYALCRAFG